MLEDISDFFRAGGVAPALVLAAVSFLAGSALLALADLFRAITEIARNTRVLAYKSIEGPGYTGLVAIGVLYRLAAILAFLAGMAGVVVLILRA